MKTDIKRKMYMGIWRFMLPLPIAISAQGLQRGVSGAETKADLLSEEERKVHHFIVQQMAIAKRSHRGKAQYIITSGREYCG
ncbi:MAG: hypothetical protein JSV38_09330 [Desulfobacterales bacterium]|nr:MAG: hypothetical protein JSV38_09330 [Desulfobacterales bacterium]